MADRFSLADTWAEGRYRWPLLGTSIPLGEADRRVRALSNNIPTDKTQIIHGDLGIWNMLEADGRILIIDFGEARVGDPYFDLASVLAGIVNHAAPNRRDQAARECLEEYRLALPLEETRLKTQCSLWAWRGLAQCALHAEQATQSWTKAAARFCETLNWCEDFLQ